MNEVLAKTVISDKEKYLTLWCIHVAITKLKYFTKKNHFISRKNLPKILKYLFFIMA